MLTDTLGSIRNGLKRLARDGAMGGNDRSKEVQECSSCGTRFDASSCPNCSSEIWRTKTVVSHATISLVVVLIATGVGVLRRIATGQLTVER